MITRWTFRFLANIITLGKFLNILDERGNERKYEKDFLVSGYNWIKKAKIGTGATAETPDMFNLAEPYAETTNLTITTEEQNGKPKITIKASFLINENIIIREVGLFGVFRDNTFMVERSVFSDGISLISGQTLEIIWTFTIQ